MTQSALARAAKVTQAAIAKIETGILLASDDLVSAIARHTGRPVAFFYQDPAPEFPLGSLLFKAHASMGKREMTEAYRHAQDTYEIYTRLTGKLKPIPIKIPDLRGADPSWAATETRKALGIPKDRPIPHLLNVLEWNGVVVLVIPEANSRDAFSFWHRDTPLLAISVGKPGDRVRLSVSHEFGHLILHRGKSRFEVDDKEADAFAAEFLMPSEAMQSEIRSPVNLSSLALLKPKWRVSIQALIRRANDLDIITERQYRYLFEQLSAMGWRKSEPVPVALEQPRALRQMVEMLYGEPINFEALAHDMALSLDAVRWIISQYAGRAEAPEKRLADSKVVSLSKKKLVSRLGG